MSHTINIREEGGVILMFLDDKLLFKTNYQEAQQIANGLAAVAKIVEERVNQERLVLDQALLMRTGAPIGLISPYNPALMRRARIEAAWNSNLRRYIPSPVSEPKDVYALELQHAPRDIGMRIRDVSALADEEKVDS